MYNTKMISVRTNLAAVFASRKIGKFKANRLLATEVSLKPWTEIPGLKQYPIVGALPHFLPGIGSIGPISTTYDMLDKLYKRFGPIARIGTLFARNPMIALFEPDHMEQVLRNENVIPNRDGFATMDYFRSLHKDVFGGVTGLLSGQGAEWKEFRTKVNPPLLLPHLVKLYKGPIEAVSEEMINRINKIKEEPEYLQGNFDFEMTRWSLESIAVVGLGGPIGCLKDDLPEDSRPRQLIKCARDILLLTFEVETGPPIWKYYKTAKFKKLMHTFETQMNVSQLYINETIEKIKSRTTPIAAEDKGILEKLLEVDPKVAVVMAIDMLAAGVDTVAHQMIGILYMLAKNPDKQAKLRDEIRKDATGKKAYVKACIKEAMRIVPTLGSNLRGTTKEHSVGGYLIPKGIDVIFAHEYLTVQDKYYPRAKEFIPERWIVDKSDPLHYSHTHPLVLMPFGFGARSCIGRRIAELEMESFLHKFIDAFEVNWYGDPIKRISRSITMYQKPFNFVFSKAPINYP